MNLKRVGSQPSTKGPEACFTGVLNKRLEATFVVIEEVETENWGWGGLPTDEYRKLRRLK